MASLSLMVVGRRPTFAIHVPSDRRMSDSWAHESRGVAVVVEVAGVEPASPELSVGLLRAQPMV